MSGRWTLRLVACAVGAAAVLTGCSAEQEASRTLPEVSSAAPSEEALPPLGPEDMPMPAEARTQDAAGAEAFVRYYIELMNRSLIDMDPQYLRQFANAGCDVCERVAQETESDAASGYTYEGGALTVVGNMSVTVDATGEAQSAFLADQAPLTVLSTQGTPVPGLVFDGKAALSSGTITVWDVSAESWILTEFTLG